jgi:hypothetical protein
VVVGMFVSRCKIICSLKWYSIKCFY